MAKEAWQKRTIRNYDFGECSSSMQKAIRRGDIKMAGYFALELFHSNYPYYVWKRLLTISAEDCDGIITTEIYNLFKSFEMINKNKTEFKGRIFISKAVIILCQCNKNRDADHLQNFIYDKKMSMTDEEIENYLDECRKTPLNIPSYAFDIHTMKGRMSGATKKQFFNDEYYCLKPKVQGEFDYFFGGEEVNDKEEK